MKSALSAAGQLLWVTDMPGPHLAPLWSALGEQQPLTLAMLGSSQWCAHGDVQLRHDHYAVVRLSRAPFRRLLMLIQSKPRAIVLDGWTSPAFLAARWWSQRRRVPVIASCASASAVDDRCSPRLMRLGRWFFHGVDVVLSADPGVTESVIRFGVPRHRIVEDFDLSDIERFIADRRTALEPR